MNLISTNPSAKQIIFRSLIALIFLSALISSLETFIFAAEGPSQSTEQVAAQENTQDKGQESSPVATVQSSQSGQPGDSEKKENTGEAEPYQQSETERVVTSLRDPFRRPVTQRAVAQLTFVPKTEVERYPVDSFKLTGVVTGLNEQLAMVIAPNGRTYHVREKMRIGNRGGVVQRITDASIIVKERIINARGVEESVVSEIKMPERSPAGVLEDDANIGLMEK